MTERLHAWLWRGLLLLAVSAVYLYAFPSATLLYETMVLLHAVGGVLFSLLLAWVLLLHFKDEPSLGKAGWILLAAGAALGLLLLRTGTPQRLRNWMYAHMALCTLGALFATGAWLRKRGWLGGNPGARLLRFAALGLLTAGTAA